MPAKNQWAGCATDLTGYVRLLYYVSSFLKIMAVQNNTVSCKCSTLTSIPIFSTHLQLRRDRSWCTIYHLNNCDPFLVLHIYYLRLQILIFFNFLLFLHFLHWNHYIDYQEFPLILINYHSVWSSPFCQMLTLDVKVPQNLAGTVSAVPRERRLQRLPRMRNFMTGHFQKENFHFF